jgi:hypothetical protein
VSGWGRYSAAHSTRCSKTSKTKKRSDARPQKATGTPAHRESGIPKNITNAGADAQDQNAKKRPYKLKAFRPIGTSANPPMWQVNGGAREWRGSPNLGSEWEE